MTLNNTVESGQNGNSRAGYRFFKVVRSIFIYILAAMIIITGTTNVYNETSDGYNHSRVMEASGTTSLTGGEISKMAWS